MKTIGLIGGMSWESTASYYRYINEGVKKRLGGLHSAKMAMKSVDFAPIADLQVRGEWQEMAQLLVQEAQALERANADFILIGTNTMHLVFDEVASHVNVPLIHIADAVAQQLKQDGITKVGLLGTKFTMEQPFYKKRLKSLFSIDVIVPESPDQDTVHNVIYNELCVGEILPASKQAYLDIISRLHQQGAQAVILGCTEIALLINDGDTNLPLYDTTKAHANMAVELALAQ
ncbi:aspartate/glutamate racemase family protein [Pseudoalteromonas sp. SMS1]|uniref:aspartate/glutamate racemase family protein n=1 Tax=Pseudoalteromonas sp. SMS1 TaxID=2908894 RepID=UPI001F162851|nr:aspartate/glutamate racemase family protein [Pseudoalteromonas sp. SMS1]MCF2856136.1 aspartate/glutamate racemase family protein [Pseudoalteromonas sp. SMS1]